MKFLLDMGIAGTTATFLRGQGYDTVHLREQGLQRLADQQIVEKARQEGRVILIHDLDFGQIVALSRGNFPSVITFRLTDMQPARVNHSLADVLARFQGELEAGALVSVSEQAVRVRLLPISDRYPE